VRRCRDATSLAEWNDVEMGSGRCEGADQIVMVVVEVWGGGGIVCLSKCRIWMDSAVGGIMVVTVQRGVEAGAGVGDHSERGDMWVVSLVMGVVSESRLVSSIEKGNAVAWNARHVLWFQQIRLEAVKSADRDWRRSALWSIAEHEGASIQIFQNS